MSALEPTLPVAGIEASDPNTAPSTTDPPSSKLLPFRPPSTSPALTSSSTWTPPTLNFLTGPWHVTHSTLPMWKTNRNVIITYQPLPSPPAAPNSLDDLVTYSPLSNPAKQKTVRGVDTPDPSMPAAYNWRGRGWLKVASSHWEVLGWGEEEGGWAVTFFAKTLFTPAGVDVYARRKGGLSEGLLGRIKREMAGVGEADEGLRRLVGEVFEIEHDW